MIKFNVKRSIETLKDVQNKLSRRQINVAVSRSLNEAIVQSRTVGRSSVKEIYNIPQRYLGGVNVVKSTTVSLTAKLYASTSPIPMDAFAPKFETISGSISVSRSGKQKVREYKRKKKVAANGVSIEVIKGKRTAIPYAFMIRGAKPRVFARGEYKRSGWGFSVRNKRIAKSGSDVPIKPLVSITVHAAVINKKSLTKIEDKAKDVFPRSLERLIALQVSKVQARPPV